MSVDNIRVAIRADASQAIGLGHIKRCLALGSALRALHADVQLITRDLGVEVDSIMAGTGVVLRRLRAARGSAVPSDRVPYARWAAVGWSEDADQCIKEIETWEPHWVVVDHYSFDCRWHRRVRDALKTQIAVIDDLADRELSAELLIDTNLSKDHRRKYSARISSLTELMGGPRFALLGPSYVGAKALKIREAVCSIGIFMGGVDAMNLTSLAIRACRDVCNFTGRLEVVTTSASPHRNAVEILAREWPGTTVLSDLPDLAAFFARHDLQIGAGGVAAWERCSVGAPTLAIPAAANQDVVLPALFENGAVAVISLSGTPSLHDVGRAISELVTDFPRRLSLSERSRALVDGLGARRVAMRLSVEQMVVRRATSGDAELIYQWRNHAATRSMSTDPREIDRSEHQEWMHASLKSADRWLLVGAIGEIVIGVIRFDARSMGQHEVSLFLDPMLHGLGLGRALLITGEAYLLARNDAIQAFLAIVLQRNVGSARLFASCGYELCNDGVWRKCVFSAAKGE